MNCQICKCETDVEAVYCCSGRDCGCQGQPINEESILCPQCREVMEYLESKDATVFNYDGDQIYTEV